MHISASSLEEKSLRDEEVLQNLPVGTTATMYFTDLGPQLGWTVVRRLHPDRTVVTVLKNKEIHVWCYNILKVL